MGTDSSGDDAADLVLSEIMQLICVCIYIFAFILMICFFLFVLFLLSLIFLFVDQCRDTTAPIFLDVDWVFDETNRANNLTTDDGRKRVPVHVPLSNVDHSVST